MDNKEFAKLLLCEATELLNEAGARHKYAEMLQSKEARLKKLLDHSYGEREESYKEQLRDVQEELRDKATGANKGGYNSKNPIHYMKGEDGRYVNSKETRTRNGGRTYDYEHPTDQVYSGVGARLAKNRFNEKFKGKEGSELNKKITERGKRSQNESIAVLLTEAALLLNDED